MSNKFKDISTKKLTYCFFDDIVNIKNFDPNTIEIDEQSCKNILINYTGHVTIKDLKYVKINSENHLYLTISEKNNTFKKLIKITI